MPLESLALVDASAPLILYSKPGCHLCDVMETEAATVALELRIGFSKVDIREERELERRYGLDVPVLVYRGEEVARHRATREEIRERLAVRLGRGRAE